MRREGKHIFRLQNVDVKQLLELLSAVYVKNDYTDIIIDFKTQKVVVEPPNDILPPSMEYIDEGEDGNNNINNTSTNNDTLPINNIIIDDELFRLITTKR